MTPPAETGTTSWPTRSGRRSRSAAPTGGGLSGRSGCGARRQPDPGSDGAEAERTSRTACGAARRRRARRRDGVADSRRHDRFTKPVLYAEAGIRPTGVWSDGDFGPVIYRYQPVKDVHYDLVGTIGPDDAVAGDRAMDDAARPRAPGRAETPSRPKPGPLQRGPGFVVRGRGQPLPAWLASWSRPLMMPPARSPPLNAPTMESAASLASRSGMRLRAYAPGDDLQHAAGWATPRSAPTLSGSASCGAAAGRARGPAPRARRRRPRRPGRCPRRQAQRLVDAQQLAGRERPVEHLGRYSPIAGGLLLDSTVTCASGSTGRRIDGHLRLLTACRAGHAAVARRPPARRQRGARARCSPLSCSGRPRNQTGVKS